MSGSSRLDEGSVKVRIEQTRFAPPVGSRRGLVIAFVQVEVQGESRVSHQVETDPFDEEA